MSTTEGNWEEVEAQIGDPTPFVGQVDPVSFGAVGPVPEFVGTVHGERC